MPQMCPGCSRDNADGDAACVYCGEALLGLLGANAILAGRYRVGRVLGCGGMGAVYLADDLRIAGRQVAVKENLNTAPQAQAQFRTEVGLMAALRHPNLPAVSDQFAGPTGRQYLVMDYIAGETLEGLVARRGPLPEAEVIALADRLLDVLAYLHSQGVVHRDVKPANVRLTPDGKPVLVDFGITKLHAAGRSTQTWARGAGSPGYAPIEQYGAGTDARSDLYSLGAVLYYLLTGQAPPAAPDLISGLPLVPPRVLQPGISIGIQQLVSKAMALHQAQRYQSAGEMRQALQGLRYGAPTQRVSAPRPTTGAKRSTAWRVLAGVVLIAVVGIVVIAVMYSTAQGSAGRPGVVTAAALVTTSLTVPPQPSDTPDLRPTKSPEPAMLTATATVAATVENPATPTAQTPTESVEEAETTAIPVASATASVEPEPTAASTVTPVPTATAIPSGPTQLTFGVGKDYAPVYHPDGQRIVFFAKRSGFWQLYLLVLPSEVIGPLIVNGADAYHPHFSPSGSDIIFASNISGRWEIYRCRADACVQPSQLTAGPGNKTYPVYSPDGRQIAFMSDATGNQDVYLLAADGSSLRNLTTAPGYDGVATFSPDGLQIAFQSDRDGNHEIYALELSSGNVRRLTSHRARDADPIWSPDGEWIAFETNRDGNNEIYTMRTDGSDLRNLTQTPDNDWVPGFSPDGRLLVYQSDRDGGNINLWQQPFAP